MLRIQILNLLIVLYEHCYVRGLLNHGDPAVNVSNLKAIWNELNKTKAHIALLEKRNQDLQNNVTTLQTDVQYWKNKSQGLENNMASLQYNVSVLQTEVDHWRSKQSSTASSEKIVNLSLQSVWFGLVF